MGTQGKTGSGTVGPFLALTIWLMALVGITFGTISWFPQLASRHGAGIDRMMIYLILTVGFLFVAGHVVLGVFVWRFSRPHASGRNSPSARSERFWSLLPALLMTLVAEGGVLILGLPVWGEFFASQPAEPPVEVEVTGEQFAWNVRYPGPDGRFGRLDPEAISWSNPLGLVKEDPSSRDDIVILGEIVAPVNRPVRIHLRSKDTLHSFFLPHLRVKQDAVPGMNIKFWFVPTRTGQFELACAELCGFGHYKMRGVLRVVSAEEFQDWLSQEPPFFR